MTGYRLIGVGDPALAASTDRSLAWLHVASVRSRACWHHRQRVLAALRSQPSPLDRRGRPGHLTGSALVVDPDSGLMLVLFHRKLQRWLQPGGHADGDANMAAVALREATEETGIMGLRVVVPAIDVDVHEVQPPHEDAHLHLDVRFVVLAPPGAVPVGNHESESLRWVPHTDLVSLGVDDGLLRLAVTARQTLATVTRRPVYGSTDP